MISTISTTSVRDAPSGALNLLVADDSAETHRQFKKWFADIGHDVTCVSGGEAAIQMIRHRRFDVIITEIIMANGDGIDVISEARKRQPSARIVAISGGGRFVPLADCLNVAKGMGAHEVLSKPLERDAVFAAIARLLGARNSG